MHCGWPNLSPCEFLHQPFVNSSSPAAAWYLTYHFHQVHPSRYALILNLQELYLVAFGKATSSPVRTYLLSPYALSSRFTRKLGIRITP